MDSSGSNDMPSDEIALFDDLWSFATTVYKTGNIEQWCLDWQQKFDLDVSFFIWLVWLDVKRGHSLTPEQINSSIDSIAQWRREVIKPIRHARTAAKAFDEPQAVEWREHIRVGLKNVELIAERYELLSLLRMGAIFDSIKVVHDAPQNAMVYFKLLNQDAAKSEKHKITMLYELAEQISS